MKTHSFRRMWGVACEVFEEHKLVPETERNKYVLGISGPRSTKTKRVATMSVSDDFRVQQAWTLLQTLAVPRRLEQHAVFVHHAAKALLSFLEAQKIPVDAEQVRCGAILHDIGKLFYPEELDQPGHQHETAGALLLQEQGLPPQIARHCISHAAWQDEGRDLEELVVSTADKLWKGKRVEALESKLWTALQAHLAASQRWTLFLAFDECCEQIAAEGLARLLQSQR